MAARLTMLAKNDPEGYAMADDDDDDALVDLIHGGKKTLSQRLSNFLPAKQLRNSIALHEALAHNDQPYVERPRYSSGRLFSPESIDSVLSQAAYNENILALTESLCYPQRDRTQSYGSILLLPIPDEFWEAKVDFPEQWRKKETFGGLYLFMLERYNCISIGLRRTSFVPTQLIPNP
jgi:hypothetical protein